MALSGRVAAITGASSGIGLACAKHLAREGIAVVLGARRTSLLEASAHEIVEAGGGAPGVPPDGARRPDGDAPARPPAREVGRPRHTIFNHGSGCFRTRAHNPPR